MHLSRVEPLAVLCREPYSGNCVRRCSTWWRRISMQNDSRKAIGSLLVVLVVVFCASFALAQGIVTGSISGTVEDPAGAVVGGAKVTARHLATNREYTAETGSTGNFNLRALSPGQYDV